MAEEATCQSILLTQSKRPSGEGPELIYDTLDP
jgi:hypothetical protein